MPHRRLLSVLAAAAVAAVALGPGQAVAHGFSSTVYADVTEPEPGGVRTELDLEYDLLVVSAAEREQDPDLFEDGMDLFETGDEARALQAHGDTVLAYVTERFSVTAGGELCSPAQHGDVVVHERDGVPYARLVLDHECPEPEEGTEPEHEVLADLFGADEGYVRGTTTIVTYDLDGRTGSAALDASQQSFSTGQRWYERFGEFFLLGAEHLLGGIDHILFLLALIVGSRRLRDIVLAATSFTVAHSVTFLLAALGLVRAPGAVVEPVIALSIAVVAAWHLWGLRRRREVGMPAQTGARDATRTGGLGLGRADALRLAVVFCFGLVHGLGFAGALGIEEPWSWTLLWSLLVFNVGIEVVQLTVIAVVFPALVVLRRRAPRTALWVGAAVAAGVAALGLLWFAQRVLGVG